MGHVAHDERIESDTGDIGEITALAEMGLFIRHYTHVLQKGVPVADGLHGIGMAFGNAESPHPVITRTNRDNGQQHLIRPHLLLDEQPVDHLVQRTVTPDDDDFPVALFHGRNGQFRGVELMLGENRLAHDMALPQQFGNQREIIQPATSTGHGIDDDEPRLLDGFQTDHCFSGALRSVWIRKS